MKWESFMDNLTAGQIVPIIGNDLSLLKDDKDERIPLREFIARELTHRLEVPYTGQTISQLVFAYPNENIILTTNAIYNKLEPGRFYLDPLEKLAEITAFKFFVSTSQDDLLEKALRKARNLKRNELRVINYSLQQVTESSTYSDEKEDFPVTVFNILGSFGNVTNSAFNDEEVLEHFFSLAVKHNLHPLADYFMQQIENKILLFIGCDFPDWFMRFVIRIMTNQRYKFRIFSDYIVNDEYAKNVELTTFLKQFNKNIITIEENKAGNTRLFIDELYEKWTEFQEHRPIQYEGTVFLSYNHPDQEKVKTLKKLLRAKGIRNVWFDIEDLDAGEHKKLIASEIKKCKVFIPLISNNSLTNNQSYTWKVEWAGIEARLMADKYYDNISFQIIPIILDDTARDDKRIPSFMRDFSIWNLDQDTERLLEEISKTLTPL